jgi:collagenase-like PrtC family protease
MDLFGQINSWEALDAALTAGVSGVTVDLPGRANQAWWSTAAAWQAVVRDRGVRFQLQWNRLIREEELSQARETLAQVAAFQPDALLLRDLGLCREARSKYPDLVLHAAATCGYHNSPGLRLAEGLGYRRVALAGSIPLKDLALMKRQTALPLEVVLPQPCLGYLCLREEYLGAGCAACGQLSRGQAAAAASLMAVLELLPGLARLGVAAVRLGWVFSQDQPLQQISELCRLVEEASPAERPRLLAAAREAIIAWGTDFRLEFPAQEPQADKRLSGLAVAAGSPKALRARPRSACAAGRVWLEARDCHEAALLAREGENPLILELNTENYAAFLGQYRRWHPRRLIWRLPPIIPEAALPFFQQALLTLKQGGFERFLAGDWGAVQLVREAGSQLYGEQTLGVRNSQARFAAADLGVFKVCLPPGRGPHDWQELVQAAPRGSFWGYLYHLPALMVCPRGEGDLSAPTGAKLRRRSIGDLTALIPEAAIKLESSCGWFKQKWVTPMVISLVHSNLPWGQVPGLARPPRRKKPGAGIKSQGSGKKGQVPVKFRGRSGLPPEAKPRSRRRA